MPYRNLLRVAVIVVAILLIPLVLTIRDQGQGWNWSPGDFLAMGTLLFITGVAIDYAARKIQKPMHRAAAIVGIILALLIIWVELAVDAVGQLISFILG